jgi:hypothetical protein
VIAGRQETNVGGRESGRISMALTVASVRLIEVEALKLGEREPDRVLLGSGSSDRPVEESEGGRARHVSSGA